MASGDYEVALGEVEIERTSSCRRYGAENACQPSTSWGLRWGALDDVEGAGLHTSVMLWSIASRS